MISLGKRISDRTKVCVFNKCFGMVNHNKNTSSTCYPYGQIWIQYAIHRPVGRIPSLVFSGSSALCPSQSKR